MKTINYISISEAIIELSKVGQKEIVRKLENILENNEVEKKDIHNRKDDKFTNHYRVDLTEDDLNLIIDLFGELEVGSLAEDGKATSKTNKYVTLLNNWLSISE